MMVNARFNEDEIYRITNSKQQAQRFGHSKTQNKRKKYEFLLAFF